MAYLLSPLASTIRGKLGDIVFTANGYRSIVAREYVTPTDPSTSIQDNYRLAFTDCVDLWQSLSSADRQLWHEYSATCNLFGKKRTPQLGFQALVNACLIRFYVFRASGTPAVPTGEPPASPGLLGLAAVRPADYSGGTTGIAYTGKNLNNEAVYVFPRRTDDKAPTVNRYYGKYSSVSFGLSIAAGASFSRNLNGGSVGNVRFVQLRPISTGDICRCSTSFKLRLEVQAP
jgi:hypothetical protein